MLLNRLFRGSAFFCALWLLPVDSGAARQEIETIVQKAEGLELAELLELAREASRIGEEPGQIEAMEKAIRTAAPEARLVLGKALIDLDEEEAALEPMLTLLDPKIPEGLAAAAARFLADPQLLRNRVLEERLLQKLGEVGLTPRVRVECAFALYRIGSGEARSAARNEMRAFLRSEEPHVRNLGVLALAEIGDVETVRRELAQLAEQPTPEGKLAKSLIGREDIEKLYERKIKNLEEYYKKLPEDLLTTKTVDAKNVQLLEEVIRNVQHAHIRGELYDREELIAAAARGMLNLLDPFSTYMTGEEYKRFVFDINQDYGGIGAFVRNVNNVFTIIRPIYSGPAYRAGLRSDDKVLAVDGWETAGKDEDQIIKRLKGKPGTPVKISVYRAGWAEPKDYEILRDLINVPVLQHELFPGGVGYIELISFTRNANEELQNAVRDLLSRGMKGMILDLRNDPGGLLEAAVEICENFLPANSLVVYTDSRLEGKREYRTVRAAAKSWQFPLVILVNERSASASEIVAGALQFHQRATIVGEQTYGKGSVQTLIPIRSIPDEPFEDENGNHRFDEYESYTDLNRNERYDYGPRAKLTIARYYFPNGQSIHSETDKLGRVTSKGGVTPDYETKFLDIDRFKLEELERVLSLKSPENPERDVFREYVQRHFLTSEADRDRFIRLAEGDGRDWKLYPDFELFYQALQTPLERNEIRKWLRLRLREAVSDARGRVFPGERFLGDYQEDNQLQKAIEVLFGKLGLPWNEIPEYRTAFLPSETNPTQPEAGSKKDG